MYDELDFGKILKGRIIQKIAINDDKDEMIFVLKGGGVYKLYHESNCCESVEIEEIHGDLNDLIDSEILQAKESTNSGDEYENATNKPGEYSVSWTWTFYKLATIKGSVTIRWLGESNGLYSEEVSFVCIQDPNIIEGDFVDTTDQKQLN